MGPLSCLLDTSKCVTEVLLQNIIGIDAVRKDEREFEVLVTSRDGKLGDVGLALTGAFTEPFEIIGILRVGVGLGLGGCVAVHHGGVDEDGSLREGIDVVNAGAKDRNFSKGVAIHVVESGYP